MKSHYAFDFSKEWTPTLVSSWRSDVDLRDGLQNKIEDLKAAGDRPGSIIEDQLVYYSARVDALVDEMKRRGCVWDGEIGWYIPNNPLKLDPK